MSCLARLTLTLLLASAALRAGDSFLQPFAVDSPWNTAISTVAKYASVNDPRSVAMIQAGNDADTVGQLNYATFSIQPALATVSDPLVTLIHPTTRTVWSRAFRVPKGLKPPAGSDAACVIVQPDGTVVDCYKMAKIDDLNWTSTSVDTCAINGSGITKGIRASNVSALGGLIRTWELAEVTNGTRPHFPHVLAVSLHESMLGPANPGYVWPANARDQAAIVYTGVIPLGTLFAIPVSVDLPSLATTLELSTEGKALARTLQLYGAMPVDRSKYTVIYAEPSVPSTPAAHLKADWKKLLAYLRPVNNVTPGTPGGGPAPRLDGVAPTITAQPANRTVTAGQPTTFSVAANSTLPLTYQWQKNGANISGATGASVTTPATVIGDNGAAFRCIVSNGAGSKTSNAATLTVNVAPAITTQPVAQSKSVGTTATFTVAASGRPTPTLQWQKNGVNISGATSASYTTPAITAADNGATYRCVATNSVGSATSNAATLTVTATMTSTEIGSPGVTGSTTTSGGTVTVKGGGADIWTNADSFRFVSQPLSGDGQITARVVSQGNSDPWAKAGVMIRESTGAGSRHAMTVVTPANGVAFQRRLALNGSSSHTAGAQAVAPYWVRLSRLGNLFTAYQSSNGTTWQVVGSATIAMSGSALIGLAVTSHDNAVLSTAVFDHITIIAAPADNG